MCVCLRGWLTKCFVFLLIKNKITKFWIASTYSHSLLSNPLQGDEHGDAENLKLKTTEKKHSESRLENEILTDFSCINH